jgi:hypothetical protein
MSNTHYIKNLKLVNNIIKGKTEGLTHADSMLQLPFPGNCMNWNLGHLLVYRQISLGAIDGVTKPDDQDVVNYGFGSEALTDSDKAIPLPDLLTRLEEASDKLIVALEEMPAEKSAEIIDTESGRTLDDRLRFLLVFHEAYHVALLEILRELALSQKEN